MNNNEFHTLADLLFTETTLFLDDYAEQQDVDIDYEINGNVLTILFANGSRIIMNTQEPLSQIWLATSQQGYHFDYQDNRWICNRSAQDFKTVLTTAIALQSQ